MAYYMLFKPKIHAHEEANTKTVPWWHYKLKPKRFGKDENCIKMQFHENCV